MSRVSSAVLRCFHSGITDRVRMLWSRSASLMTSTRQSVAIATSILRIVAACWASLESNRSRSSLVTPSTMPATAGPNSPFDLGQCHAGVLDGVVEQRGSGTDRVEAQIGDDRRDRNRVGDVGLARQTALALMGPGGIPVRVAHQLEVLAGAPGAQGRQDAFDVAGRRRDEGPCRVLGSCFSLLGDVCAQVGGHPLRNPIACRHN